MRPYRPRSFFKTINCSTRADNAERCVAAWRWLMPPSISLAAFSRGYPEATDPRMDGRAGLADGNRAGDTIEGIDATGQFAERYTIHVLSGLRPHGRVWSV